MKENEKEKEARLGIFREKVRKRENERKNKKRQTKRERQLIG